MDRVSKILDFVNSTAVEHNIEPLCKSPGDEDKTTETDKVKEVKEDNNNNTVSNTKNNNIEPLCKSPGDEDKTTETDKVKEVKEDNNILYSDVKRYNAIRRKLKKQQTFPCNIDGKAYYTQEDVNNELKALADGKRAYNKQLKQNKLKNTKIEVNDLEELDNNEVVEDDGYIYTHNKPIGIVKDNKRYRLPTTNITDRANIFNEIGNNKEVITKLLKTDNDNEFNEITLNNIHNEKVKKRTQQHINNDIVKDNTWNRNEFIKLMERKMNEINKNNDDKMNRTNIPQAQKSNISHTSNITGYNNTIGLNPLLFKKY